MKIAIVGAGPVGVGMAVVFARAGHQIAIYESSVEARQPALGEIQAVLRLLDEAGLLVEPPDVIFSRIGLADELEEAVDDVAHVQECATGDLDAKRQLFRRIDGLLDLSATIATSSSSMTTTMIASEVEGRTRCLTAHPSNPPYLLPVIELGVAEFTSEEALTRVFDLVTDAGMTPVTILSEIPGLAYNRLQGALLREAYCLVRDGIVSATDLDTLVRDGLGRRWAVIGPFATADLNTLGGIVAHAQRLGPAYLSMGKERGQVDPWTPDLVERVASELRERLPSDSWDINRRIRDQALARIVRALADTSLPGVIDPRTM